MRELTGEVAVVTGAGRGIGRAIALRLARAGASLVLTSRTGRYLSEVIDEVRESGAPVVMTEGDAADSDLVARTVDLALSTYQHVDILVNNVGIGSYRPFTEASEEEFDRMFATNVRSMFLFTRAVVPHMISRHYGQIISVASGSGKRGYATEALYCATKFSQAGLSEALDQELLGENIKVSTVFPGGVNTNFALGAGRTADDPALQAMLDPDHVAEAVYFIAAQPWKSFVSEIQLRPVTEPR